MSTGGTFKADHEGFAVLCRCMLGLAAAGAAHSGLLLMACLLMIGSVWLDATTGWFFRRRGAKSQSTAALERYADVACFVAGPVELVLLDTDASMPVLAACIAFVLAAVYRLARFDVEGLTSGRYTGVPVTYNGYAFPAAALVSHMAPGWSGTIFVTIMLAMSALMISRRVTVPEL